MKEEEADDAVVGVLDGDENEIAEGKGRKKSRSSKPKKKTAKNKVKSRKLAVDDASENEDGSYDADAIDASYAKDEELVRTPPSSHHPSEDEADDYSAEKPKPKKSKAEKAKRPAKKTKATVDNEPMQDANKVKTRNKLVGDIQDNQLYGSDDGQDKMPDFVQEAEDFDGEKLDLGMGDKASAPKKQFNFLNKVAPKNGVDANDLNAKIKQLGFSRDTNVNELAARGVKLSLRDELIR